MIQAPNAIIYDLKSRRHVMLDGHQERVSQIKFSYHGEHVITGCYDKIIRVTLPLMIGV